MKRIFHRSLLYNSWSDSLIFVRWADMMGVLHREMLNFQFLISPTKPDPAPPDNEGMGD